MSDDIRARLGLGPRPSYDTNPATNPMLPQSYVHPSASLGPSPSPDLMMASHGLDPSPIPSHHFFPILPPVSPPLLQSATPAYLQPGPPPPQNYSVPYTSSLPPFPYDQGIGSYSISPSKSIPAPPFTPNPEVVLAEANRHIQEIDNAERMYEARAAEISAIKAQEEAARFDQEAAPN